MRLIIETKGRTSIWVDNEEKAEILRDYIYAKENLDIEEIQRLEEENEWLLDEYFIDR